jgi:hypothetical protein
VPADALESPEVACPAVAQARRHLASFVGLSPEQIASQIENSGDEELLFAMAHALLDLKTVAPELEKLRSISLFIFRLPYCARCCALLLHLSLLGYALLLSLRRCGVACAPALRTQSTARQITHLMATGRMQLYDDTMKFIESFSPEDKCVQERVRRLRVMQLHTKRILLQLEASMV